MDQKTKIVLGIISLLLLILVVFLVITISEKQQVIKERDALKTDITELNKQIDKAKGENRRLSDKVNALGQDIDRVTNERNELQGRFDQLNKEKEDLANEVQSLKSQGAPQPAVAQPDQALGASTSAVDSAYWAGILKAKTDLELRIEELRNQFKSLQISSEQLQREKASLELEVKNLTNEKDELIHQADYNQKLIDSISQDLVREKNDKYQIQNSLKFLKSENLVLKRQINSLTSRKTTLERKVVDLQSDKSTIENKVDVMDSLLKDNMLRMDNLKVKLDAVQNNNTNTEQPAAATTGNTAVNLAPIVVRPQADTASPSVSSGGKVLAVNRESNFIIVDLGQDSGVKIGDTFQVYNQGKPIAIVEVMQIRNKISACDIKKEVSSIRVGDLLK